MSENELVPVDLNQLPSTQVGTDEQFAELAKSTEFLGRLQLYTKGKAINHGLVKPGCYGIPASDEEVEDLGDEIDIMPLARRPKAIDMTDTDAVLVNYDPESDEFKRIAEQSMEKESHCMYGPRSSSSSAAPAASWNSSAASRAPAAKPKKIYPFLPLTPADIARQKAAGNDVDGLEPHGPLPLTLKSRLVEKGTYSWHVPVVSEVRQPLHQPADHGTAHQGDRFLRQLQGRWRRDRQGARGQEAAHR